MKWLALALFGLSACHRSVTHCPPGVRPSLEIRNGAGALELALKGNELCDGQHHLQATLDRKGHRVTLTKPDGSLALALARESDTVGAGRDADGPKLRLYRDAHELRVLRGDGVPLGSIAPQPTGSILYNPASSPIGKVERRDHDAVITDMSGAAQTYVVPAQDFAAAGVFGVPSLSRSEQLAVYLYWSHGPKSAP